MAFQADLDIYTSIPIGSVVIFDVVDLNLGNGFVLSIAAQTIWIFVYCFYIQWNILFFKIQISGHYLTCSNSQIELFYSIVQWRLTLFMKEVNHYSAFFQIQWLNGDIYSSTRWNWAVFSVHKLFRRERQICWFCNKSQRRTGMLCKGRHGQRWRKWQWDPFVRNRYSAVRR